MVTADPFISAHRIQEELAELPVVPSVHTIRRRLRKKYSLTSCKAAKKPLLSAKNVRDRLHFCQRYKDWTAEQWKQVLFADESTFTQFHAASQKVWRPVGQRYRSRFTVPVVKQAPTTMVWGAIAAAGPGPLWFMPPKTTINGAVYISILEEILPAQMPALNCSI
jgi:hypothetical protein